MTAMTIRPESSSRCAVAFIMMILALAAITACKDDKNEYIPPPPPHVTVSQPVQKPVTEYLELTGNLQAYDIVDLVARVEGFLTSINFQDGDMVKKGQLLFVIEPQPYQAKVQLQEATVEQQKALLLRAEQEYARQLRLIKDSATAQSEVEKWLAERDAAKAALDEAKAQLVLAKINLGYTQVTAPFLGRIERHLKDVGNLVGAAQPTSLATIVRLDPIYAYFNINERDLVRIMKEDREQQDRSAKELEHTVFLQIAGEKDYPHQGKLDYASAILNPTTGTLLLRATFTNPNIGSTPVLLPGMFAQIRIPINVRQDALLVPDSALRISQGMQYLLVVDGQNTVEERPVEIGTLVGEMRVIQTGLKPDEWVIVDGVQFARPGAKVTPDRKSGAAEQPTQSKSEGSPPASDKSQKP